MNFANPVWLLMIPIVMVLPWIRQQKRFRFSNVSLLGMETSWRLRLKFIPPLLISIAGMCLVVALARPHQEFREQVLHKDGIDIMLVVDTSSSMNVDDFRMQGVNLTRMDAAKKVMQEFVTKRSNDRIGMVIFGDEAYTYVPLTLDHTGMIDFLRSVSVGLAGGRTAIGDGIAVAAKRLQQRESTSKIMIVLTDGKSNVGIDPVEAGYAASKFGIHIYTIGIGNTGEDPLTGFAKQSGVDEKMLSDIADRAQGQFYRAKNTVALQDIYAEIDRLEPTTAEYTEYIYKEEKAGIWIALSILGLLGYLLISETWLRRVP